MNEGNTIVYSYNKDTKTYTIDYKEMQKINRKLKERFTLKQENKQLKEVIEEVRKYTNDKLFDDYTYCSYEDVKQNINEILDKAKVGDKNE